MKYKGLKSNCKNGEIIDAGVVAAVVVVAAKRRVSIQAIVANVMALTIKNIPTRWILEEHLLKINTPAGTLFKIPQVPTQAGQDINLEK